MLSSDHTSLGHLCCCCHCWTRGLVLSPQASGSFDPCGFCWHGPRRPEAQQASGSPVLAHTTYQASYHDEDHEKSDKDVSKQEYDSTIHDDTKDEQTLITNAPKDRIENIGNQHIDVSGRVQ